MFSPEDEAGLYPRTRRLTNDRDTVPPTPHRDPPYQTHSADGVGGYPVSAPAVGSSTPTPDPDDRGADMIRAIICSRIVHHQQQVERLRMRLTDSHIADLLQILEKVILQSGPSSR